MAKSSAAKPMASNPLLPKAAEPHEPARPRLGRGLAALIGDSSPEPEAVVRSRAQKKVPIEFLRRNPRNPRLVFDEAALEDLTASIRERGIIQPILVRTIVGTADAYEIIAGERRWRAAQRAGLHDVPIVIVEADDKQALEIAIVENVQRADLNIMEEAGGYERLIEEFAYTQSDLARTLGKSRPHVANTLRLLKLPPEVRDLVAANTISAGHARALLGARDPLALARRIVAQGLSVRAIEEIVRREGDDDAPTPRPRTEKDADTRALEKRIGDKLGLAADIKHKDGKGEVRLKYSTLEQLDALVALLGA